MKRKLLLVLSLTVIAVLLFAFSVSAEGLIPLDVDPGLDCDDSLVSYFASVAEPTKISTTERAVLTDGTKFYVVPAYYVVSDDTIYYANLGKLNKAIGSDVFTSIKTSLVRIQLPSGIQQIVQGSKFEAYSALRELHFPLTLTVIQAQDAFGNCKNLEYISSIEHMTQINVACFAGCSKLAVDIVWPKAVTSIGRQVFSGCSSLKSITFQEGFLSISGTQVFNGCTSLETVILPNSLTNISKGAFLGCTSLTTFSFGAGFTTFNRSNNDYEILQNTPKLKYVYLPEAFVDAVAGAKKGDYKGIFTGSKNVTFFYTGSYENAVIIRDKMKSTEANEPIGNAEVVLFDPSIDYTSYAETLGKSIIVAGYSACEAFYDGVHDVSENYDLVYGEKMLLGSCTKAKICAQCGMQDDASVLSALFVSYGYSTDGKSVVQGFFIDKSVREAYESVLGKIDFGVIAAIDSRDDRADGVDVLADVEKYVAVDMANAQYDYFEIKINNVADANANLPLFFCCYVQYGESTYYIHSGAMADNVNSVTYNEISASLQA